MIDVFGFGIWWWWWWWLMRMAGTRHDDDTSSMDFANTKYAINKAFGESIDDRVKNQIGIAQARVEVKASIKAIDRIHTYQILDKKMKEPNSICQPSTDNRHTLSESRGKSSRRQRITHAQKRHGLSFCRQASSLRRLFSRKAPSSSLRNHHRRVRASSVAARAR